VPRDRYQSAAITILGQTALLGRGMMMGAAASCSSFGIDRSSLPRLYCWLRLEEGKQRAAAQRQNAFRLETG